MFRSIEDTLVVLGQGLGKGLNKGLGQGLGKTLGKVIGTPGLKQRGWAKAGQGVWHGAGFGMAGCSCSVLEHV